MAVVVIGIMRGSTISFPVTNAYEGVGLWLGFPNGRDTRTIGGVRDMSRLWITALAFAVIGWIAYDMIMKGWNPEFALIAVGIVGALLVLEFYDKYIKK